MPDRAPWARLDGAIEDNYALLDLYYGLSEPRLRTLARVRTRDTVAHQRRVAAVAQRPLADRVLPQSCRRLMADAQDAWRVGRVGAWLMDEVTRWTRPDDSGYHAADPGDHRSAARRTWEWLTGTDGTVLFHQEQAFLSSGAEGTTAVVDAMNFEGLALGRPGSRTSDATWTPFSARPRDPTQLTEFMQGLERSRFTPASVPGPDQAAERIHRSCKYGIEHTVGQGHRVHFLLDDLRYTEPEPVSGQNRPVGGSVLGDKRYPGVYGHDGHRSFTGAELRYIYRNRFRGAFRRNIVFWKNGQSVAPPWEDPTSAEAWDAYRPKHLYVPDRDGRVQKVAAAGFDRNAEPSHAVSA